MPFNDIDNPQNIQDIAAAMSLASNPYYGKIDARIAGIAAVVEAVQKVLSVGGNVQAITDCLCFGNPEKPKQMGDFVACVEGIKLACESLGLLSRENDFTNLDKQNSNSGSNSNSNSNSNITPIPIVAGNVSLYNESKNGAIPASPMICAVGSLHKSQLVTHDFSAAGNAVILVGARQPRLGGSLWYAQNDLADINLPNYDLDNLRQMHQAILALVDNNYLSALKSIHLGGVAATLSLMGMQNQIGVNLMLDPTCADSCTADEWLFSEAPGFVMTVEAKNLEKSLHILQSFSLEHWQLGLTENTNQIRIYNKANNTLWLDADLAKLKSCWAKEGLNK